MSDQLLYDGNVLHAINVARFGVTAENEVIGLLNEAAYGAIQSIGGRIGSNRNSGSLGSALYEVRSHINVAYERARNRLILLRNELAEYETVFQWRLTAKAHPSALLSPVELNGTIAELSQTVFGGRSFNVWVDGGRESAFQRLSSTIKQGYQDGDSTDEIAKTIHDEDTPALKRQVGMLARMSTASASDTAKQAFAAANPTVLTHWQFTAILDSVTSKVCSGLNGQVFKQGEGPRPPRHPRCRSTAVPKTNSTPIETQSYDAWREDQDERVKKSLPDDLKRALNQPISLRKMKASEDALL